MSATMLSSHSMTPLVTQRLEKDALNNLTDRFAAYLSRVRQMREQSIHMDNINFVNTTKILEDEILSLKTMYERQLEELRNQLEDTGRERSSYQMMSAKNAAQLTDVSQRFDIQIVYLDFMSLGQPIDNFVVPSKLVYYEHDITFDAVRTAISQNYIVQS